MLRLIVLAALIVIPTLASAQEVVATTRAAPPAVVTAAEPQAPETAGGGDMEQVVHVGPCTPGGAEIRAEAEANGVKVEPDRAMHGQVSAAIGTGGYRHADATVCKPIGANSSLTVHLSDTHGGGHRRW